MLQTFFELGLEQYGLAVALSTGAIFGWLLRERRRGRVLGYDEAIRYLVRHRPTDPRVAKGAILVDRSSAEGLRVYVLFLDNQNRPLTDSRGRLYGTSMGVNQIDQRLTNQMGEGNDLLIVS